MPLLWQLLNYGMISLRPLIRQASHCLYFNRILKHIFFPWPLTPDVDIRVFRLFFYGLLMLF